MSRLYWILVGWILNYCWVGGYSMFDRGDVIFNSMFDRWGCISNELIWLEDSWQCFIIPCNFTGGFKEVPKLYQVPCCYWTSRRQVASAAVGPAPAAQGYVYGLYCWVVPGCVSMCSWYIVWIYHEYIMWFVSATTSACIPRVLSQSGEIPGTWVRYYLSLEWCLG